MAAELFCLPRRFVSFHTLEPQRALYIDRSAQGSALNGGQEVQGFWHESYRAFTVLHFV
jgi:hypothetical protein